MRRIVKSASAKTNPLQQKKIWALQECVKFAKNPSVARAVCQLYQNNGGSLTDVQWNSVDRMISGSVANMKDNSEGEMILEYIKNTYGICIG